MTMKQKTLITLLIPACLSIIIFCTENNMPPVKWIYIPNYVKLNNSEVQNAVSSNDVICFTGVIITDKGRIRMKSNSLIAKVLKKAHESGKIIYPLIAFENSYTGKKILNSKALIKKTAESIVKFVSENGFPGYHLDLEYIDSSYAEKLLQLIKTIKASEGNLKLTMAIYPQINFKSPYSGFHDISLLAPYIDEAVIMCYDMHRPDTLPGPVTDILWAEKNIIHTLEYLDPYQVILGIPAYGYLWADDSRAKAVSAKHGASLKKKYGSSRDKSGCVYIEYFSMGVKTAGYIADKETENSMKILAEKYRLRGTALWRAGFEENMK